MFKLLLLLLLLFINQSIINCIILTDTDNVNKTDIGNNNITNLITPQNNIIKTTTTSTTTTSTTTIITTTKKHKCFNKLNNSIHNNNNNNNTNDTTLESLCSNENIDEINFLAENTNKTIPSFVDHNKFVIKSNNSSNDETYINLQKNTSGALNVPLTLIIIVIGVVFVIIIIIISSLFVMRRRFSKWRLDTNTGTVTALTNEDGKNSSGDNISSTNDALISKQEINQVNETNINNNNNNNNNTNDGHINTALSASQSTNSIKIENEINKAISEINAVASNENIETTKLLDEKTNEQLLQTESVEQQQQQQQQDQEK